MYDRPCACPRALPYFFVVAFFLAPTDADDVQHIGPVADHPQGGHVHGP